MKNISSQKVVEGGGGGGRGGGGGGGGSGEVRPPGLLRPFSRRDFKPVDFIVYICKTFEKFWLNVLFICSIIPPPFSVGSSL